MAQDLDVGVEAEREVGPRKATQIRWLIFCLLCGASFTLYLHRYTWGMIKRDVSAELDLSTTQLGYLDSAFMGSYAGGQIPGGMLGDWFGTHLVLFGMVLLWSGALLATAYARGFADMFLFRFLFGLGQAGCYPNLSKATKSWFPWSVRTVVQGMVASFFGRLGGAASYVLMGTVLMGWCHYSWRTSTMIFSAVGLAFAAAFLLLFRSTPGQHPWSNAEEANAVQIGDLSSNSSAPARLDWSVALRNGNVRGLVFQQFTAAYVDNVFSAWIPMFLLQQKKVDISAAGWMSALPLIGGAIGGMTSGVLQSALYRRFGSPRWSRSLVGLTGNTMATLCMLVSLTFDAPLAVVLTFMVLKFFADWSQPATWGAVTDIGGRNAASVFAIINTSGSLAGVVAGPIMAGMLEYFSGSKTPNAAGWTALFLSLAAIYLASAASWLFIDCTKPLERSEA